MEGRTFRSAPPRNNRIDDRQRRRGKRAEQLAVSSERGFGGAEIAIRLIDMIGLDEQTQMHGCPARRREDIRSFDGRRARQRRQIVLFAAVLTGSRGDRNRHQGT
jgi:hypothetical protein